MNARDVGDISYRTHGLHFSLFAAGGVVPWTESSVTEERLRFVARLLDGEDVTHVIGPSPKVGHA
jgi:hypothetical protein